MASEIASRLTVLALAVLAILWFTVWLVYRSYSRGLTDARGALQSFRSSCPPLNVSGKRRPLGIGCSFRVLSSVNYRSIGFCEPALPLAISSAVRVSFAGPRRSVLTNQCTLSSSFAFLQSLPQPDLANQPQPVSSSLGLFVPFST
jgi:hypothetical protein